MGLVTDAVGAILCLLTLMAQLVAKGLVVVVNLLIVGIADVATVVLAALPAMPDWPVGSEDWTWLNWFLPVSGLIALVGSTVTLVVAWFGYRVVLNWVKAL